MSAAELKRAAAMSEADPRALPLPFQQFMSYSTQTISNVNPAPRSFDQYPPAPPVSGDVELDQGCINALMQLQTLP